MNNNDNNNQIPSVDDIFGTGSSNNQSNNGSLENTGFNNNQTLNGTNVNGSMIEPNVGGTVNFDNNNANNSQASSIDASASINVQDVFGSSNIESSIQMPNVTLANSNVDNNINNVNPSEITFNGNSTQDVPVFQSNDNVNTIPNVDTVNLSGKNSQVVNDVNNMGVFSKIDTSNGQYDASTNATNGQVGIQNPVSNAIDVNSNVINQDVNAVNPVPVTQEPVNPDSSVGVGIVIDNGNAGFNPVDVQSQSPVSNQVIPNDFNNSVVSNEVNQNTNVTDTNQVQANTQDNSININQNNTDTNGQVYENKAEQSADEELIEAYVGTKYDKFKNGKFNVWALLFGPIYLAYRKMFWYGIGLCVVETILTNVIKIGFLFGIVLRIVLALFVNKFYLQDASKKVNKIKSENANVSKDALLMASKLSGGISKELLALAMYVTGTITTIALIISMITGTVNFFKNIFGNINWSVSDKNDNTSKDNSNNYNDSSNGDSENNDDTNENYTFNGSISYNTSVNINNTFNVTIPSGFEEDSFWGSSDYHFEYELSSSQMFGDCKFGFYSPNGYKSAEGLANAMQKYYVQNNSGTSVTTTKINNINWYNFSNVGSFSTDYYYLTSKDGKVYVVSYESGKDNLNTCNSYRDSIMNSISLK